MRIDPRILVAPLFIALVLWLPVAAGASGPLAFTSPASGASLSGTQTYVIEGTITPLPAMPDNVFISVDNPAMQLVDAQTVSLVSNGTYGTFSYATNVGGNSGWTPGAYTITAEDSDGNSGTITFTYTGATTTTSSTTSSSTSSTATSSDSTVTSTVTSTATKTTTVTQTTTTTLPATTSTSTTTTTVTGPTTTSTITGPTTTVTGPTTTSTITGPTTTVTGPTTTATSTVTGPTTTSTITGPTTTVTGPTTTQTTIQTVTSTTTSTSSSVPDWVYAVMVLLLVAGLAGGYILKRPETTSPTSTNSLQTVEP